MAYYGAVETGGTKVKCLVGSSPADVVSETTFPTTTPHETLSAVTDYFKQVIKKTGINLRAVGIASFGPLDLNPDSDTYGFITHTPKLGWKMTDVTGNIARALTVPVYIDTDVNGAALGEHLWGAGRGLDNLVYLTVGTGIGGGAVIDGRPIHGLVHPEMGHIRIQHDWAADPYKGCCPFHGDCLEGLASGPGIEGRWGIRGENLPKEHPAWKLEAYYLAQLIVNCILTLSPRQVIIGGGVMRSEWLYPMLMQEVQLLLAGYVQAEQVLAAIDQYIVQPELGSRAGVLGALALAVTNYN